jgi:hypothetical protein
MAGSRILRYVLALCTPCFLASCVRETPLVECTGSIVTTEQDSCEAGLWAIPLDVKIDGQIVGSIGIDRAPFGPFKYSNRQWEFQIWAGKRQLRNQQLRCELSEHREYSLQLRHMGDIRIDGVFQAPCEGRACLTAARETLTPAKTICVTDAYASLEAITTTRPPTHTCNAIIRKVSGENTCTPGAWDQPIEVSLSGHVIGSMEPGATTFGPFPYTEPDPWVELHIGKRSIGYEPFSCDSSRPLQTLEFSVRHRELPLPERDPIECEGYSCLSSAHVHGQGTYCESEFDLEDADSRSKKTTSGTDAPRIPWFTEE